MPFLIASAPVRSGSVKALRARAAAGEAESVGRPADFWSKRPGVAFDRAGAVIQPYLTPRFAVRGSRESVMRKAEGDWSAAPIVESLGAMVCGFGALGERGRWIEVVDGWRYFSLRAALEANSAANIWDFWCPHGDRRNNEG